MLIQGASIRPVINLFAFQETLVLFLLEREGTSKGTLDCSLSADFVSNAVPIDPKRVVPLSIEGFRVKEYVVPFEQVLNKGIFDQMRGVSFRARSAVRVSPAEYREAEHTFGVLPLPQKGSVVQFQGLDLSNPHFKIKAEVPPIQDNPNHWDPLLDRPSDSMLVTAYERTHAGGDPTRVDAAAKLKAERLASIDLAEQTPLEDEYPQGMAPSPRPNPYGRVTPQVTIEKEPVPRYMRDLGFLDE